MVAGENQAEAAIASAKAVMAAHIKALNAGDERRWRRRCLSHYRLSGAAAHLL
jgi:hypothetical protein